MESYTLYLYYIYFTLSAIVLLNLIVESTVADNKTSKFQNFVIIFFSFLYFILFSTRDITVGADTENYLNNFYILSLFGLEAINFKDYGFYFYLLILNNVGFTVKNILYGISFMYVIPIIISFLSFNSKNKLLIFFAFISLFFFESMAINVMRQGIAAAFFLLSLVFYFNKRKKWNVLLLLLTSFLFHASVIIPIIVFFVSTRIKKLSILIVIFIIATVLSFINFDTSQIFSQIPILNILFEARLESYYHIDPSRYKTGFRWDFYLFNLIFMIIGVYFFKKKDINVHYPEYKLIFTMYVLLSSYFIIMFNVPFSDRFGVYSWILIPFILAPMASKRYSLFRIYGVDLFFLALALFLIFKIII